MADFFSFGTNDLTQMTLAFSRDDAEGGFLTHYLEDGVLAAQPVRDARPARRRPADRARAAGLARGAKPALKLGICGEHGGDPDSIAFCHRDRARLRVVLAVPGADRAAGRRPGRAGWEQTRPARASDAIDVAFTPGDPDDCAVAVVIDVLRATTTITQALDSGLPRGCWPAAISTQARELAAQVQRRRVLAGERQCVKPEGFDLGNSPSEFDGEPLGETLVLTTTNGTRAIVTAAGHAETVVIGSLLNLLSCAAQVARHGARGAAATCSIQCAGVRGDFTMDDAYTAGRYVAGAGGLAARVRADRRRPGRRGAGRRRSSRPARGWPPRRAPATCATPACYDDVRYCAREGVLETVPTVVDVHDGVAMITA